jgi:cell division protein FtsI/penicillin-binding protein 2
MNFSKIKFPKIGFRSLLVACLALSLFLLVFIVLDSVKAQPENSSVIFEISYANSDSSSNIIAEQSEPTLAAYVKTLLNRYHPPNAFILLMDAKSGKVLAWGQRENDEHSEKPTFFKRDSFPAASLAKIVTATAALEDGKNAKSEFPRIGRNSTLYKRQIFPKEGQKNDVITLENAFAKSNNPAMGIIGMELGQEKMQKAAEKLGFVNFNYPDSDYGLAESASGFTKRNMLSPLQAANAVRKLLFTQPDEDFQKSTYEEIRNLFLKTITDGTAQKAIRKSMYSHNRSSLYVGGKTGSLDGDFPAGRYDWFVGFAQSKTDAEKAVIIVVMQVHGLLRNQHSSTIAGMLINEWAKK